MIRDPKPKRGRPTLPDDVRQSDHITLRLKRGHKSYWVKAAKGQTLKDFVVSAVDAEAERRGVPRYDQ
jgi:hypothetical protein